MIARISNLLPVLAFLVAAPVAQVAWGGTDIGQVKTLAGMAHVERGDQELPVEPGFRLEASDVVVTGEDSRLGITFIDNTRLSAGPNSRIELENFQFDTTTHAGEFTARIDKGTLSIISGQIAKSHPDAMKVKTPTSVLAVRGTKFLVRVD